jgi:AmiR/NasT family two-component response regulator
MPVVMYSAYADQLFMKSARDAGAFAYLVKGCPPRSLIDTLLEAALQPSRRRTPAARPQRVSHHGIPPGAAG